MTATATQPAALTTVDVADTAAITRWEALANDIAAATELDALQPDLDYSNANDLKYAKSLVAKHRKLNARIERARKEAKAFYLEGGRGVDSTAKTLAECVGTLIDRHAAPIKALEDAEAARIRVHQQTLQRIDALGRGYNVTSGDLLGTQRPAATVAEALECMALLEAIDPSTMEEHAASGRAAIANASADLAEMISDLEQREAEAAELLALREAAARREQADREEAIRQAAIDAERKAAAERDAAKDREAEAARDAAVIRERNAEAERVAAERRAADAAAQLEAMQQQDAARKAAEYNAAEIARRSLQEADRARQELLAEYTSQLLAKIRGMDHQQIADAIATDALDAALRVDWSMVVPF